MAGALSKVDLVWVTGGSVFVLSTRCSAVGCDQVLHAQLHHDALAYGGCSAGACVCAPSLRGFEAIEDEMPERGPSVVGRGLIPFSIVPRYGWTGVVGEAIQRLLAALDADGIPYRTLSDGQVLSSAGKRLLS